MHILNATRYLAGILNCSLLYLLLFDREYWKILEVKATSSNKILNYITLGR